MKRSDMIKYIERCTGCNGVWREWSNSEIRKLYVFLKIGAPHYFESVKGGHGV